MLDVRPMPVGDRIGIKMEDSSLSDGDGATLSSPIAMTAVVKVEYEATLEDEINYTDQEPVNQYSALKKTVRQNCPISPTDMSDGKNIFLKMEGSASNFITPGLAASVKVENEVSSEDTPNITDSEENGSSTFSETGSVRFSSQKCTSSGENTSVRASNFNAFPRVGSEVNSEGINFTDGACEFFSARSGDVKIKVEKADMEPEDVSTAAECMSFRPDSIFAAELNVIIKKEDLGVDGESQDVLVDNHTRNSINHLEVSNFDDEFQATACDEINESSVWGLCQEPCSDAPSNSDARSKFTLRPGFLSDEKSASVSCPQRGKSSSAAKSVNNRSKCEKLPHSRFQKSQTFCDALLKKACVVLKDLFPKNRRSSQRPSEVHTNSKFCRCIFCTGKFKLEELNDSATKTASSPSIFICWICSAKFKGKFELKVHLRSHTGETPYACTHCPAKFSRKSTFQYHLISHTGEKPFPCTYCSAKFKKKSHMDRHVLTHTGERPFSCTYCPARFRQSNGLKDHLLTHTGDKPYTCKVCSAKFRQRHTLKGHLKTHAEITKST